MSFLLSLASCSLIVAWRSVSFIFSAISLSIDLLIYNPKIMKPPLTKQSASYGKRNPKELQTFMFLNLVSTHYKTAAIIRSKTRMTNPTFRAF